MYVFSLLLYLYLFFLGVDMEMFGLLDVTSEKGHHGDIVVGVSILLLYVIPLVILLIYLSKRWRIPKRVVNVSLMSGLFIACWISGYFNDFGDTILREISRDAAFLDNWSNALTAPLVEEALKATLVFWSLYILKQKGLKMTFVAGISVGLGFQIMEDVSYLLGESDKVSQAIVRVTGAFSSHWSYTAILVVGVYSLIHHTFNRRMSYFYLLLPVLLHFLWNSPLNDYTIGDLSVVSAGLSAITLFIFIKLFIQIDQKELDD